MMDGEAEQTPADQMRKWSASLADVHPYTCAPDGGGIKSELKQWKDEKK